MREDSIFSQVLSIRHLGMTLKCQGFGENGARQTVYTACVQVLFFLAFVYRYARVDRKRVLVHICWQVPHYLNTDMNVYSTCKRVYLIPKYLSKYAKSTREYLIENACVFVSL